MVMTGYARIEKVRPGSMAFEGIRRIGYARRNVRGGRRRKVPARRETPDAYARRIDAERIGMRPNVPHRPLRVHERRRMAVARPEAVLQDKGRDSAFVEPFGNLPAFMIHRQMGVPAAGTHNHAAPFARTLRGGRW